jgi:hypothetical protein
MGAARRIGFIAAVGLAMVAASASAAPAAGHRVYSVRLTIEADSSAGRIEGTVLTGAPRGYCDVSRIRIREVMPGRNLVVARVRPRGGRWHVRSSRELSRHRVYAEVSGYKLPGRAARCRADRSRKIVAP